MDQSKCFTYSRETGEFVSEQKMFEDPMEPGRFVPPACATLIAPPEVAAKQAAVFRDGAWSVVVDRRGETWWLDQQPVPITELGDPRDLNPDLTEQQPPQPPPPPVVTVVAKVDFYRRLSDDEVDQVEHAVASLPTRQRRIFESANTFRSDAPEWESLMGMAVHLLGKERALVVLAPSE